LSSSETVASALDNHLLEHGQAETVSPAPAAETKPPSSPGLKRSSVAVKEQVSRTASWVFAALFFAVVLIIAFVSKNTGTTTSWASIAESCPDDVNTAISVVIDPMSIRSQTTKDEVLSRFKASLLQPAKDVQRFSVFTTSASHENALKPLLAICKYPSVLSRLLSGRKSNAQLNGDSIMNMIREALETRVNDQTIFVTQQIADIALTHHLRANVNKLVVFSDMLDISPRFSLAGCDRPSTAINAFKDSRRGSLERPHFRRVSIELHVIPRIGLSKNTLQCRNHFWRWYFGDIEGPDAQVVFDYLPSNLTAPSVPEATKNE
jgi:hypothetical protein